MKSKKRPNKTSTLYLTIPVLVCLIALLLCSCTSTGKNETTTTNNVTDQVVKKDNSDAGSIGDDQEIVCRSRILTGTSFKKKVCATKAEWAKRDRKKGEEVERIVRDIDNKTNINTATDENPMGAAAMAGHMPGM